mgnify:CR=1 FL=1
MSFNEVSIIIHKYTAWYFLKIVLLLYFNVTNWQFIEVRAVS